jgi:hypothetical protein
MDMKKPRVDPKRWIIIRAKYEMGQPIAQLAKEIGLKPQSVRAHAKRNGWQHGSMAAEALRGAKEKALESVTASYEEVVKEVNERQLRKIRRVSDIIDALIVRAGKKLQWAEAKDKREAAEAIAAGKAIPAPHDTLRELYAVAAGIQGLRAVFMDLERLILGIKEGAIQPDDCDGTKEISRILAEARAEYVGASIEDDASKQNMH